MADISAEIAAFRDAAYGEEVRESMISLANKLNGNILSELNTMEQTWNAYKDGIDDDIDDCKDTVGSFNNRVGDLELYKTYISDNFKSDFLYKRLDINRGEALSIDNSKIIYGSIDNAHFSMLPKIPEVDINNLEYGKYINANGEIADATGTSTACVSCIQWFSVTPNSKGMYINLNATRYDLSFGSYAKLGLCNSNKELISSINLGDDNIFHRISTNCAIFDVPNNVSYICVDVYLIANNNRNDSKYGKPGIGRIYIGDLDISILKNIFSRNSFFDDISYTNDISIINCSYATTKPNDKNPRFVPNHPEYHMIYTYLNNGEHIYIGSQRVFNYDSGCIIKITNNGISKIDPLDFVIDKEHKYDFSKTINGITYYFADYTSNENCIIGANYILMNDSHRYEYMLKHILRSDILSGNELDYIYKINDTPLFQNSYDKKILNGLRITVIGDSITEKNFRANVNWVDYIQSWGGCTIQNLGISGTGFARKNPYINRINQITNPNMIGVAVSFNDMNAGLPLGTKTDTGTSSLAGYANDFFDALLAEYPTIPILCYSQGPWGSYRPGLTNPSNWMLIIKDICQEKGITFYDDLFYGCALRPWIKSNQEAYYVAPNGETDTTHPNDEGHKIIARYLIEKFSENNIYTYQ